MIDHFTFVFIHAVLGYMGFLIVTQTLLLISISNLNASGEPICSIFNVFLSLTRIREGTTFQIELFADGFNCPQLLAQTLLIAQTTAL
jgi:hypothetical protein